jgi:hypothetical protein
MKKHSVKRKTNRKVLREKINVVLLGGFLFLIVASFVILVWQKTNQRVGSGDYEGKIVDRWGEYSESTQGSRPHFILQVESPDGKRFTVKVDASVYESARVGMRIKSRAGQIVLVESEQSTSNGK